MFNSLHKCTIHIGIHYSEYYFTVPFSDKAVSREGRGEREKADFSVEKFYNHYMVYIDSIGVAWKLYSADSPPQYGVQLTTSATTATTVRYSDCHAQTVNSIEFLSDDVANPLVVRLLRCHSLISYSSRNMPKHRRTTAAFCSFVLRYMHNTKTHFVKLCCDL